MAKKKLKIFGTKVKIKYKSRKKLNKKIEKVLSKKGYIKKLQKELKAVESEKLSCQDQLTRVSEKEKRLDSIIGKLKELHKERLGAFFSD